MLSGLVTQNEKEHEAHSERFGFPPRPSILECYELSIHTICMTNKLKLL